jgi:hypothetical protein
MARAGLSDSKKSASAIYFVTADQERGIYGYTWRMWWSGTSFYIKGRASHLAAFKVSLHGPDPARPNLRPGFKIAMDENAVPKAVEAGSVHCGSVFLKPQWFSGRKVQNGVRHVLTFRSTWDLFCKGCPSAPNPGDLRADAVGLIAEAPKSFKAADIEIYVSDNKPYWPFEAKARRDNSCIEPIRSGSGQYLTGVSFRRPALNGDAPVATRALKSRPAEERVRGIATAADDKGVLWIVEHWISPSAFLYGFKGAPSARRA